MSQKLRIASPVIFEPILSRHRKFSNYDWLFEGNPNIVSSFSADVIVSLDCNKNPLNDYYGFSAKVRRQLVAHSAVLPSDQKVSVKTLEAMTYITMSQLDDGFLQVAQGSVEKRALKPSRVFRANDVLAAECAVKLKIGYAALPEFMLLRDVNEDAHYSPSLAEWRVTDGILRIQSQNPYRKGIENLQKEFVPLLNHVIDGDWNTFGQISNIVPLIDYQ